MEVWRDVSKEVLCKVSILPQTSFSSFCQSTQLVEAYALQLLS
jgi:hypothetical protein